MLVWDVVGDVKKAGQKADEQGGNQKTLPEQARLPPGRQADVRGQKAHDNSSLFLLLMDRMRRKGETIRPLQKEEKIQPPGTLPDGWTNIKKGVKPIG